MKRHSLALTIALIVALPAAAGQWYIPAAAHVDGDEGSHWRTTLMINNFGSLDASLTVTLLPRNQDNSDLSLTAQVAIGGGETVEVTDAVWTLFSFEGAAALKLNATDDQLVITSRTYSEETSGTFGQAIPALSSDSAFTSGRDAMLLGLTAASGQRTNVGWVNLDDTPNAITVELYEGDGTRLDMQTFTELAYGHSQFNIVDRFVGADGKDNLYAIITASGRLLPYASVVASGSNDPIYVTALGALHTGTRLLLPAVAHVVGVGDTNWGTDVWIQNAGSNPAQITLELWLQGQEIPVTLTNILTDLLPVGQQLKLHDVVQSVFYLDGAQGALVVRSDNQLLATSRTFNTTDDGITFGQFILAQSFGSLAGTGETLYLPGAVFNDSFRSNLGLVATSDDTELQLLLRGSDGQELARVQQELAVNEQFQRGLASIFSVSSFDGATVEVTMTAAGDTDAGVAAYLSIIDEGSTDPTFAPAARGIGFEPNREEIQQLVVAVTDTLTGGVENSGPGTSMPKTEVECIDVQYSLDEVGWGESPEGQCWASTVTYDECYWVFPNLGFALAQDGFFAYDICVIDEYPSTLSADLSTVLTDLTTLEEWLLRIQADLQIELTYDGLRPDSAALLGEMTITTNEAVYWAWADLDWGSNIFGLVDYPVGTLKLEFPYQYNSATGTVEATVTYDGSQVVFVEARVGYWQTGFYLDLVSGEVTVP